MSMNPIETKYGGCHFRSRLEARWAVFFDALGVKWEYEKEGYPLPSGWYLPDFWLPYETHGNEEMAGAGFWVEIKPIPPTDREMQLMAELAKHTNHRSYIFSGMPDCLGWSTIAFQHWRGGEPVKIPALVGKTAFGPTLAHGVSGEFRVLDGSGEVMPSPLLGPVFGWTGETVIEAVNAARSARFEHGEQG